MATTIKPLSPLSPLYFYVWDWWKSSIYEARVKSPATCIIEAQC